MTRAATIGALVTVVAVTAGVEAMYVQMATQRVPVARVIANLTRAVQTTPNDAAAHLNLGRVHERKGQWSEAIDCYKHALTLNPNYALAKRSLSRLISMMN